MKDWMRKRSGKDNHRPRLSRRLKITHVNRQRIEWERKGEIKKDWREFRFNKT